MLDFLDFTFAFEHLPFLLSISIISGFLNALTGGGGLMTLPALMLLGISPLSALATNKLQGTMGTATATFVLLKKKKIQWSEIKKFLPFAFIGALVGSTTVQFISTDILSFAIPIVLLCTGLYFLLEAQKKPAKYPREPRPVKQYQRFILPTVGCYDGMFGPGTGSFFAAVEISWRKSELVQAFMNAKALNFATNIASLLIFLYTGHILWGVGVIMMLGQTSGAWLGSHCLLTINPKYLRFLVVFMSFAMLYQYMTS